MTIASLTDRDECAVRMLSRLSAPTIPRGLADRIMTRVAGTPQAAVHDLLVARKVRPMALTIRVASGSPTTKSTQSHRMQRWERAACASVTAIAIVFLATSAFRPTPPVSPSPVTTPSTTKLAQAPVERAARVDRSHKQIAPSPIEKSTPVPIPSVDSAPVNDVGSEPVALAQVDNLEAQPSPFSAPESADLTVTEGPVDMANNSRAPSVGGQVYGPVPSGGLGIAGSYGANIGLSVPRTDIAPPARGPAPFRGSGPHSSGRLR